MYRETKFSGQQFTILTHVARTYISFSRESNVHHIIHHWSATYEQYKQPNPTTIKTNKIHRYFKIKHNSS